MCGAGCAYVMLGYAGSAGYHEVWMTLSGSTSRSGSIWLDGEGGGYRYVGGLLGEEAYRRGTRSEEKEARQRQELSLTGGRGQLCGIMYEAPFIVWVIDIDYICFLPLGQVSPFAWEPGSVYLGLSTPGAPFSPKVDTTGKKAWWFRC